MGVYDADIQGAKEAITEAGEISTVRRVIPGTPDPAKPWVVVPPVVQEVSVAAVYLNYNLQGAGETYIAGSLIKTGDKKVLIAAADISDITASDRLVRADGTEYQIVNTRLLDPNGQKIMWELQVRQ